MNNLIDWLPDQGERGSLAWRTAETLRRDILSEALAPGATIVERDLAMALGVSRTPMREALRALAVEGLVEYSATRRLRVSEPSLRTVEDLMSVLCALERLAAELACIHGADDDIVAVVDLFHQFHEAWRSGSTDARELFELDMAFHRRLVVSSYNDPLVETHRQYMARLWRARFKAQRRGPNFTLLLTEHRRIAASFQARNGDACARAVVAHLRAAMVEVRLAHLATSQVSQKTG